MDNSKLCKVNCGNGVFGGEIGAFALLEVQSDGADLTAVLMLFKAVLGHVQDRQRLHHEQC